MWSYLRAAAPLTSRALRQHLLFSHWEQRKTPPQSFFGNPPVMELPGSMTTYVRDDRRIDVREQHRAGSSPVAVRLVSAPGKPRIVGLGHRR